MFYEMLTGRRPFQGEDITETIAAIVKERPDLSLVPSRMRRLLESCLEKDPRKRLQAIGDMRLLLDDAGSASVVAPARPWMQHAAWSVAGVAVLSAGVLAFIHFRETAPAAPVIRSTILPPETAPFDFSLGAGLPALSPDSRRIVFGARTADGRIPLWVRSLDGLTAQPLAGTEGATFPFWSPDSQSIAFFADRKLKKISASGGAVLTIADASNGRGGSWSRDGVIVFAPSNNQGPLLRVSSAGGAATPVSKEFGSFPWFLPDGQHFLYQEQQATDSQGLPIRVGSLDGSASKVLGTGGNPLYSSGHLLFLREGTLMAWPFDAKRLEPTGEAVPVAEQVQGVLNSGRVGAFAVSETGLLVYREGGLGQGSVPTLFDRAGKQIATLGGAAVIDTFRFSPDGRRVAVVVRSGNNTDIWVYDVSRGLRTRFTFDPSVDEEPVWSPDGRTIVFSSNRKGSFDLYRKAVDSVDAEQLLYADSSNKSASSWSSDGKVLLYTGGSAATNADLFSLSLTPETPGAALKPSLLLQTPFNENRAQFSPDGRWILYMSNESGRPEVYATTFPPSSGSSGKLQISTEGAAFPKWRNDGREVVYVTQGRQMMAAEVTIKNGTLDVGVVHPLFMVSETATNRFDVTADGQRFLMLTALEREQSAPLTLIQNWTAGLTR